MNLDATVERTVSGLGFELVEVERAPRGLLRVYIDRVPGHHYPEAQGAGEFVTVDDCEAVTRQLQYVLEVENADYERLEVSSPGLDRPLKREADFERFAGQAIDLTLKLAFEGRKHWRGVLGGSTGHWQIELLADKPAANKPGKGKANAKARAAAAEDDVAKVLSFSLDELREARLVPVVNFKGRQPSAARPAQTDGEQSA